MKPVEEDRLADTMDRIRQRLSEKRGAEEVGRLKEVLAEVAPDSVNVEGVEDAHASSRYEKLINIKDRGQIFRVDVDSIEKIDAAGDYMCIRSEERRVGKECVSTCRSRWSRDH